MKKIIAFVICLGLVLSLSSCEQKEGEYDGRWAVNRISSNLNKSIEKGLRIKKMQLITEFSKDVMYPENPPTQILSNFEAKEPLSDDGKNLEFSYRAFYADGKTKEADSKTNYKGFYLNVFYPYEEYNKIKAETIEKVEVEKTKKETIYKVYYKEEHFSKRYEWEYARVLEDYEVFTVDEDGYIIDYESVTDWKKNGLKHESYIRAKVVSYEPFKK